MRSVLIFDADNTLWDTDSVFRSAQLAMLKTLAKAKLTTKPKLQLGALRTIDQELVRKIGHAEYDFKLLAAALSNFYYYRSSVTEAVNMVATQGHMTASSELAQTIEEAYRIFIEKLKYIPPLYPDTDQVLSSIRASITEENQLVMIIHSEGDQERLERILEAHSIRSRRLFHDIIIAPKSKETFTQVKNRGLHLLEGRKDSTEEVFVLVGDSLHRDIKPGNQAGFTTIYKPSAYKGLETPNAKDEWPTYTISSFKELPSILKKLGLPIPSLVHANP